MTAGSAVDEPGPLLIDIFAVRASSDSRQAEAETAKRHADEIEAKIGKKRRARRRKGEAAPLPIP